MTKSHRREVFVKLFQLLHMSQSLRVLWVLLISAFKGKWRFSLVVSYGLVGLKCLISLQCDIKALILPMICVYITLLPYLWYISNIKRGVTTFLLLTLAVFKEFTAGHQNWIRQKGNSKPNVYLLDNFKIVMNNNWKKMVKGCGKVYTWRHWKLVA